jgi:hypothetical protein
MSARNIAKLVSNGIKLEKVLPMAASTLASMHMLVPTLSWPRALPSPRVGAAIRTGARVLLRCKMAPAPTSRMGFLPGNRGHG